MAGERARRLQAVIGAAYRGHHEPGAGTLARLSALCLRTANAPRFQTLIIAVIVANAVVLGLQTYDSLRRPRPRAVRKHRVARC